MKKLNKRAIAGYTPDTAIFRMVFCIVISFGMVFFMIAIYSHVESTARIPNGIEEFSAIERFMSDECFALDYINQPRVLDWQRFTKENLHSCYSVSNKSKKIAFTLELKIPDIPKKEIKTRNWNDAMGPKIIKNPIDTKVYYGNEIKDGKLTISEQNVQVI